MSALLLAIYYSIASSSSSSSRELFESSFSSERPLTDFFPQVLLADREVGLGKLNTAIEAGEKLYPDTASAGRERIRQQLRTAKDVWDSLLGDLNELQRRYDNVTSQWSTFREGQEILEKWMLEVETWIRTDTDLRNTLQEKRSQLQNNKVSPRS